MTGWLEDRFDVKDCCLGDRCEARGLEVAIGAASFCTSAGDM